MYCVSRLVKTFHRFNVVSPSISVGSFSKTYCFQTASTPVLQRNSLRYSYCSSATAKESSNEENRLNDDHTDKSKKTKLLTVLVGSAVAFLGSSYILYNKMKKAKAEAVEDSKVDVKVEEISEDEEESGKKKKKHGFRERRIIEYENRIRQYSTPDKVFRYFASIKDDSEVFMTPADFVRALTPGKIQPEGLGLDAHERFDREKHKYVPSNQVNQIGGKSVFAQMGEYGLISFSDYIFLLTVLSIPPRMFEMAFQMFDLNGDGNVDPSEFEKIQSVLFSMTSTGMRHRDHSTTGSVLSSHVNSGLKEYMFGKTLEKKLTTRRFIEFQRQLQKEVMLLEFQSYEPEGGKISEVEFADMLLTYSSFHEKKKQKILKRVRKAFKDNSQGVSFKDYLDFFCFLRNITEAEIALSFHNAAGKSIDPVTFKRVASTVSDVSLQDHVIKVVYKMFDENDDGELSHKEFVLVMKNQLVRGLENPKDTGFAKLLSALSHCAKHCVHQVLMGEKK